MLKVSTNLAVLALIAASLSPEMAHAQDARTADGSYQVAQASYTAVLGSLESNGYRVIEMKQTFLGRLKILAKNRVHLREIVVSRSTGEVKSDVILKVFLKEGEPQGQARRSVAATAGKAGSDVGRTVGDVGRTVGGAVGAAGNAAGGAVGAAGNAVGGAVGGVTGGLGLGG